LFGDEPAVVISRAEVLAGGHIVDVRARIVPTEFEADWYADARDEGETADFTRLLTEMAGDGARNAQIADLAFNLARQGQRVLVFSHRVEHCRALHAMLSLRGIISGLMLGGEDYAREFDETAEGLRSGVVQVGVGTYQAIGTAIDLPEVDAGICATPMHKSRQVVQQVRGRLCRRAEGKAGASLYFLWDRAVFGRQPVVNLRRFFGSAEVSDGGRWADSAEFLKAAKRAAADAAFASADEVRGG
jgi:superfamily II DNA or RNA helicase